MSIASTLARYASLVFVGLGLAASASAVTTATFDAGGGAGADTFPGSAGDGWAGAFVHGGAAPTVTNANPLDGGTNYLSYTAQAANALNVVREYEATTQAHTISWLFRFDAADMSQFTLFADRIHFFGNDGAITSGGTGTTATNSWTIIATGAQGGPSTNAPQTPGNFAFFDHNGSSDFVVTNTVDTGIALTPGHIYAMEVIVDPSRKQYGAVITNQNTGQTFSRMGMDFRNQGGTGAQHTDIHWGKFASAAGDAFPISIDSIKIDTAKQIVANFTDGQNPDFADAFTGKAGGGWNGAWTDTGTTSTVTTANPLDGVAGNPYLSVGATAGSTVRTIRRQLDPAGFGDVDPSAKHVISWQWRFDGEIDDFANAFTDRIHFFGDANTGQSSTTVTNTWGIGIVAGDQPGNDINEGRWYFYDNNGSTAFIKENMFDTGLGLLANTVYDFEVVVDPVTGTYSARIFDGANTVFADGLTFRNGLTNHTATFLHFGAVTSSAADDFTFSLDNIRITAFVEPVIPEPATMSLLGLAGLALLRRRRVA